MYCISGKNQRYRFKYSNEDAIWHLYMSSRKNKYYNMNRDGKMKKLEFIPMNQKKTVYKAVIMGPTQNHAAKVVGEFIPQSCVKAYMRNIAGVVM